MAPQTIACWERRISYRASACTNCCTASRTRLSSMRHFVTRIRLEAASTDQIAAPGTPLRSSQPPAPKSCFTGGQELREINWSAPETFELDDYLADFRSDFHDIRDDAAFAYCLDSVSYGPSHRLARDLLAVGSAGIVYPSVRRSQGTCLVCFRPALVTNVRKGETVTVRVS